MRARIFLTITVFAFIGWFVPWVFLLKLGIVRYLAYEQSGHERYPRLVGPLAPYVSDHADWTPAEEMTADCRAVVITSEDLRFYSHYGVDPTTLRQALSRNWEQGKIVWGGSSISQQIVKNVFLNREKTFLRKSREAVGAVLLDRIMSKRAQLTWYLNIAEFGPRIYGIRSAARSYFNLTPRELSLSQCITLASMLPDPIRSHRVLLTGQHARRLIKRQRSIVAALSRLEARAHSNDGILF